jgi:hypothetical protein
MNLIDNDTKAHATALATAGAQHVAPVMSAGGNKNILVDGGAVPIALPAQTCKQVTFCNNTGAVIEVQQDGAGDYFPVLVGSYFPFYGLVNMNQLRVRRVDQAAAAVILNARWES